MPSGVTCSHNPLPNQMDNIHSDTTLTINLDAVADNYRYFAGLSQGVESAAVVKANAYGLGVEPVASRLYDTGCRRFFVATLDEAIELRNILKKDAVIFIFHGIRTGQEKIFKEYNLIPVLNTLEEVELWNDFAADYPPLPAIIHIDSGMNRLGLNISDAETLAESGKNAGNLSNLQILYIMSHLACSTEGDNPKNRKQLEKFSNVRTLFPNIKASFANSWGSMISPDFHFDLLRPGSGLYGVRANIDPENQEEVKNHPIKNVIKLTSKIIQLREVKSRQPVGYGATQEVKAGSTLATIPVGYADGYMRHLTHHSHTFINGRKAPVIGRVSMDSIILDVSEIAEENLHIGTEVELIGDNITVDLLAKQAGTIGYEILTNLGNRYKREYISN